MSEAPEPKHHGYTSSESEHPEVPEPTYAERARTLLTKAQEGTLATHSRRRPGYPFASLMPYALDSAGRPLLLVSTLAVHTQNLKEDGRSSLLVASPDAEDRNPLALARVTLLGRCLAVPPETEDAGEARKLYLDRHASARYWVDYPDFQFWRMDVEEAYYVGGFGVMGWVSGDEYRGAEADPLTDHAAAIIDHMNEDHADALELLVRSEGIEGVEEVRMSAVDRLGYHLRLRTDEGMRGMRLAFPDEARTPAKVREYLVEQVRAAREGGASA